MPQCRIVLATLSNTIDGVTSQGTLVMRAIDFAPEVYLVQQLNTENQIYVGPLLQYFCWIRETNVHEKWMEIGTIEKDGKVALMTRFASHFITSMLTIFPSWKPESGLRRIISNLRLRLNGTFRKVFSSPYSCVGRYVEQPMLLDKCLNWTDVLKYYEAKGPLALEQVLETYSVDSISSTFVIESMIEVSLEWFEELSFNPSKHSLFINLFGDEATKDLTLISGTGTKIKCHKSLLIAHSNVIATILSWPGREGMNELKFDRVQISDNGLRLLIQILYGQEVVISELNCQLILILFQYGYFYEMKELMEITVSIILQRNYAWYTANVLLDLYLSVKWACRFDAILPSHLGGGKWITIKKHLLDCMKRMKSEILSCERYRKLGEGIPQEWFDLYWDLHCN